MTVGTGALPQTVYFIPHLVPSSQLSSTSSSTMTTQTFYYLQSGNANQNYCMVNRDASPYWDWTLATPTLDFNPYLVSFVPVFTVSETEPDGYQIQIHAAQDRVVAFNGSEVVIIPKTDVSPSMPAFCFDVQWTDPLTPAHPHSSSTLDDNWMMWTVIGIIAVSIIAYFIYYRITNRKNENKPCPISRLLGYDPNRRKQMNDLRSLRLRDDIQNLKVVDVNQLRSQENRRVPVLAPSVRSRSGLPVLHSPVSRSHSVYHHRHH